MVDQLVGWVEGLIVGCIGGVDIGLDVETVYGDIGQRVG